MCHLSHDSRAIVTPCAVVRHTHTCTHTYTHTRAVSHSVTLYTHTHTPTHRTPTHTVTRTRTHITICLSMQWTCDYFLTRAHYFHSSSGSACVVPEAVGPVIGPKVICSRRCSLRQRRQQIQLEESIAPPNFELCTQVIGTGRPPFYTV